MFFRGVSTRKVGEILDGLCGERLSASKVSTVAKELDQAVWDFANSPIDDDFVFLFLDALSIKIRFELKAKKVKLIVMDGVPGLWAGMEEVYPLVEHQFCRSRPGLTGWVHKLRHVACYCPKSLRPECVS
jgi:transposase-like protein